MKKCLFLDLFLDPKKGSFFDPKKGSILVPILGPPKIWKMGYRYYNIFTKNAIGAGGQIYRASNRKKNTDFRPFLGVPPLPPPSTPRDPKSRIFPALFGPPGTPPFWDPFLGSIFGPFFGVPFWSLFGVFWCLGVSSIAFLDCLDCVLCLQRV